MKHYSASQINQYIRCPAQWYFRYVEGLKRPPTSAMVQGTSYHKALETNYAQKITSKTDMPVSDVADAYATIFNQQIQETKTTRDEIGVLKDEGVGLVSLYQTEIAPSVQPLVVEKGFTIDFDNVDYTVEGFIDIIQEGQIVRENKTTARTPSDVSSDHLLQGTLYAISEDVNAVTFDYAVKLKKPKMVSFTAPVSDEQKDYTLRLIGKIDHAIQAEVFFPNRFSFMCSRNNCAYWSECETKHGGRVKD